MLYIVRDELNKQDKGSDGFERAIKAGCKRHEVECEVVDKIPLDCKSLILEPCNFTPEVIPHYTLDKDTTAKVAYNLIKEHSSENIAIFGRGLVVGKPLREMLEESDIIPYVINSKTTESEKIEILSKVDIVVLAVPWAMKIKDNLSNKIVIDPSNSYDGESKEYYDYRAIGKSTVDVIIENYKNQ